jgi:predicted RND superfamily exporter protein
MKVYLSLLGVSVVGQSILASYGICFYMGFFWGPIHPILPFLLLGVGVDNSFVIMQVKLLCLTIS